MRGPFNEMQRRRATVGGWVGAGQVLWVSRGSVTFRRLPICSGKFVSLTLAVCKCCGELIWELVGVIKVAATCTHHVATLLNRHMHNMGSPKTCTSCGMGTRADGTLAHLPMFSRAWWQLSLQLTGHTC